ncbi:hypothetical protein WMY93_017741 [Mugilogobius chulae]|uniref:Uncharacterized protein n=1 Tax=Mugilogobius chulae TaxID=88201 RepID=A0AAW0P199_9GOBI
MLCCIQYNVFFFPVDSFAAEEGISDGELEDILSEANETSSRLRPSTLNHSGSGSTRHSERIQTRSNWDPAAPQAITRVPKYLLQASSSNTTENTPSPCPSTSASDETEQRKRRRTT